MKPSLAKGWSIRQAFFPTRRDRDIGSLFEPVEMDGRVPEGGGIHGSPYREDDIADWTAMRKNRRTNILHVKAIRAASL